MAKTNSQTRVKNAKNLAKKLQKLPKDVREAIEKTMERGAKRTAKKSSADVAKKTGDLSRSIEAKKIDNNNLR